MENLDLFNKYQKFEALNENELNLVINYTCANLNSCFRNYPFWYDMYCYLTKSRIVIRHRKDKDEKPIAKLGECVCQDEIINFLKNKENLCNCNKGCASVYFNAVF